MRLAQAREGPAWARSLGEAERRTDDRAGRRRAARAHEVDQRADRGCAPAAPDPNSRPIEPGFVESPRFLPETQPPHPLSGMWPLGNDAAKLAAELLQSLTGKPSWAIGVIMNVSFRHVRRV